MHLWPGPFFPQLPAGPGLAHTLPTAQSPLPAQVALHESPLHTYGKQLMGAPSRQVPLPLQVLAGI